MSEPLCLLLRLEGPLQSWGYRSRFTDRDTGTEPTKSGVIGILCCALGRDRSESVDDLVGLQMTVRVDREGKYLRDFHTAGAGKFRGSSNYAAPKSSGGKGDNAVIMEKHYLQDASFLVALEGPRETLERLSAALADPAWTLSLGRKSCPPTVGIWVGLRETTAEQALGAEPVNRAEEPADQAVSRRIVRELPLGNFAGEPRQDVPIAWPDRQTRTYTTRYVTGGMIEVTAS